MKSELKKSKKKGFTLLELAAVMVIVAILSTLAITHYTSVRERVLDKEAVASLRLIEAAERIYQSENLIFYPPSGTANTAGINTNLKLNLTTQNWNYQSNSSGTGSASRSGARPRTWTLLFGGTPTCSGSCL